ncbi:2-oxoacid dehydrogenases acyltransferase family protein [Mycobacterium kansasii 732]|nr:2-oxoacid dehydrogenases acyltransferase family protein [Mycobacterium kansasii 732]
MANISSPFGQNEWLVEEMYRKFRDDPSSVDPSWHEFLVDYNPEPAQSAPAPADNQPATIAPPAEPVRPAAKPAAEPAGTGAAGNGLPTAAPGAAPTKAAAPPPAEGDELQVLRGAAAAVVKNMSASLDVPTATSVRAVPAKLLIDNRIVINNQLKRNRGGKISFTHLLGYALVQAVKQFPNMNRHYAEVDGKPNVVTPAHTNLGLAIDLQGKDGKRSLVVAGIKRCETMRFAQFVTAYEDIVRRARDGKLTADDFAGVTISLTNPGTIGTVHSVPRLMAGQGAIIGVGAMEYPAEFQGPARSASRNWASAN